MMYRTIGFLFKARQAAEQDAFHQQGAAENTEDR